MPKDQFTIVVPTRNAPERCLDIMQQFAANAAQAEFPHALKILFLVNDSEPGISDTLATTLAAAKPPTIDIEVVQSDKNYLTVEENIKNNLLRNLDRASERFLIIGNSDSIDFASLARALRYMEEQRVDLLLVGLMNCESWEKKIIRALYTTPRHFYRRNFLSQDNCTGPGIFGDVMLDYGPVDYLAYIGCQIYTKPFFKELCGIKISDPLYSLPLGTLELSERHKYNIGFYHDVVLHRIDVLNFGPTDGRNPPDWWVEKSRTLRGLSANLSMAVVSGSRDLSDSAFAKLANANTVAIRRAEPVYIYWNFLSSIIRQFLGTFIQSQKDPTHRYAPSEVADIVHFGARLEKVDLRMPDGNQAKLCDWLKRFGVTAGSDIPAIQQWIMESAPVFAAADARPQTGLWFVKKAG